MRFRIQKYINLVFTASDLDVDITSQSADTAFNQRLIVQNFTGKYRK